MTKYNDDLLDWRFAKHQDKAPEQPEPLQSNYPADYLVTVYGRKAPKLQKGKWFLDVDGETKTTAATAQAARQEAATLKRLYPGSKIEARYWEESEDEALVAYEKQRQHQWETIIYKR